MNDMTTGAGKGSQQTRLPLHGLSALRLIIVLVIGVGYASTMGLGADSPEWGRLWGYDPSRYGIQLLFVFSGFLATRSFANGRTVKAFFSSRIRSVWPALIAATLFSVFIIYPLMCAPDAPVTMSAADLGKYALKTIFLIDPGARMPGLMDDAKYMCLLQGAIWTLQWGLILHVGFVLGWFTRLLQGPRLSLFFCTAAIALYVTVIDTAVLDTDLAQQVKPFLPGLRLGYAYLIGVTLYFWQDRVRFNVTRLLLLSATFAGVTCAFYGFMPWSSLLEVMGVLTWLAVCLLFLYAAPLALKSFPRLSAMLYVTIWPAAQIVVALTNNIPQMDVIIFSTLLAFASAGVMFVLLRQARIQSAGL